MNTKDLINLGVPPGEASRRGVEFIARYILKGLDKAQLRAAVEAVVRDPAAFVEDELRGDFARALTRVDGRCARRRRRGVNGVRVWSRSRSTRWPGRVNCRWQWRAR